MAGIGLVNVSERLGNPVRLSADGYPTWMDIGATVAWELVTPAANDVVLAEGTSIKAGEKFIEIGTPLVKVTSGPGVGKYAPFDSTKANGQQTLSRGDVGLMDGTLKEHIGSVYTMPLNTELTGLIIGGLVFRARLKIGGAGQASLVNLLAALPLLELSRVE